MPTTHHPVMFLLLQYLTTHKDLRQNKQGSEKDGSCRSFGFFLPLRVKGKQKKESESVRVRRCEVNEALRIKKRRREQEQKEHVPSKVCDQGICA